jgi:hypothetical protein
MLKCAMCVGDACGLTFLLYVYRLQVAAAFTCCVCWRCASSSCHVVHVLKDAASSLMLLCVNVVLLLLLLLLPGTG